MDFIKKSGQTFITQIFVLLLNLLSGVIIARGLGPSGRGIYAIVYMVYVVLSTFASLGIGNANIYFIGKKKYQVSQIFTNSIIYSLGLGLLTTFTIVLLSFGFNIETIIKIPKAYLIWITILVPFSLFITYVNSIILALQKVYIYNILTLVKSLVFCILVLTLFIIDEINITNVIIFFIFTEIINLFSCVYIYQKINNSLKLSFSTKSIIESLKFGCKGHIGTISQLLNYRIDIFILALFLPPKEIGYYAIAIGLVEKLLIIPNILGLIIMPKASSLNREESNYLTMKVNRVAIFIISILSLLLCFISKFIIIVLFGKEYMPSLIPLEILLPGMIFLTIHKVVSSSLTGQGIPEAASYATSISLIINIIGNFILIPLIGIKGAALASTFTYLVNAVVLIFIYNKKLKINLKELLIITLDDLREIFYKIQKIGLPAKVY